MKDLMKESAKRTGILTINKNLSKDVEKLLQKYISSAQSQGVDLDTLGEQQLKYIIQLNKQPADGIPQAISANSDEGRKITEALFGKQKAPVVDMTGKTIDTSQGIMGGRSVKELMESGQITKGTSPKQSDKVRTRQMFKDSNLNETDDAIKARLEADNKKSVKKMGDKREMTADEIEDFEMEMGDLDPYDFDGTIGSANKIRKEAKDYEAYMYSQYKMGKLDPVAGDKSQARKRFLQNKLDEAEGSGDNRLITRDEMDELESFDIIPEDMATGGRAGYYGGGMTNSSETDLSDIGHGGDALTSRTRLLSPGSQATTSTGLNYLLGDDNDNTRVPFAMGKRAFLKFMGAGAAGIAGLKTGLFGVGKKAAVKEAVKQTAGSGAPPAYFFKLVNKIKTMGDDVTVGSSTMPRTKVTKYKDYELTENLDGSKQIQKIGKENDMITKDEYMTYTKGQADETTKGKKVADDYEEVTEINSRIYKDNFNDPDYEDGINLKEILEEVGETVTKKADGGRIGYSGGGILKTIIAKSAASKGLSVRDFIKATSYKGLSPEVKMYISAKDFAALKGGQKEMYDNFIDMAKTRKSFQENVEGGKGTPVGPLFKNLEKTMDEQSFVPKTVTADDIAEMELMVRNRFEKNRKLNATGGLATMLGE